MYKNSVLGKVPFEKFEVKLANYALIKPMHVSFEAYHTLVVNSLGFLIKTSENNESPS